MATPIQRHAGIGQAPKANRRQNAPAEVEVPRMTTNWLRAELRLTLEPVFGPLQRAGLSLLAVARGRSSTSAQHDGGRGSHRPASASSSSNSPLIRPDCSDIWPRRPPRRRSRFERPGRRCLRPARRRQRRPFSPECSRGGDRCLAASNGRGFKSEPRALFGKTGAMIAHGLVALPVKWLLAGSWTRRFTKARLRIGPLIRPQPRHARPSGLSPQAGSPAGMTAQNPLLEWP